MRALLLAAGIGTRLRPFTDSVPKCLVSIHGRPLLAYWLDLLFGAGLEGVVINTHYLSHLVDAFVETSQWNERIQLVYEERLLGTGGTLLANRDRLGSEPFLVAHADNLTRFDVPSFVARHRTRPPNVDLTMMTFRTDDPESCGIVEVDSEGIVRALHEKTAAPQGNLANAAVYICEPTIFDLLSEIGSPIIDISTQVLPRLVGRMLTFHNSDYHRDIGTPESLSRAEFEYRVQ